MVSLSDIPCVGKVVDRISDVTVDAGSRGLRYLFRYNSIVNNLTSQIEKVKVQEEEVSRKADADRADGKTIKDHVIKWRKEVEEIKSRANELSKQRASWNPVTRFRLGRKATQEAKNVVELIRSGVELLTNEIAYLPADENIPLSDTTYQKFDSRKEAYGKLMEALAKEDGYPVIGIYGMPGVGKTRMMEQAWKEAKDKKIFNKVARANVGDKEINVIKLQSQLAGYLGCHLESEENEERRASQLKNSLMNWGKTLVILDDVWHPIPLQNIGIPLEDDDDPKDCKILLTSRKKDVCLRSCCKDPIKVDALTFSEAWVMFKKTASTSKIDSLQDTSLAEDVCKECAGLPLLIQAVGNALKCATEDSWKDALSQLQNCNLEEIDGIDSRVYTSIRLSFDKLKKAEKRCLLLCSLFPEDAEIAVKMLEDFATGSQLLDRTRNVKGVVDNLKSSSLLLEGNTRRNVKLHDVIRDIARSIAATEQEYAFLFIRGDSHFPDIGNYSTRKLLQIVDSGNFRFPTSMMCPDLHTLWLECNNKPQQFSKSFFEGIGNLKILVLKGMHIFPEKMSVQTFDKLTMLILDGCDLNEISLNIVPENLEILRILNCSLRNPLDLPKLKSIRKLELLSDGEIEMVPNAISTLSPTLEELHIPGGFKICDAEGKRSVSISSELNKLTVLKSLNIRLEDSESCPNENIVANLLDFIVHIGDKYYSPPRFLDEVLVERSVIIKNRSVEVAGKFLVERAQEVILEEVMDSGNVFSNIDKEAFSNLKRLSIENYKEMEHLVAWMPRYEIQQSQPLTSFSKLTSLQIYRCSGLKYLFCVGVAKCLVQLQDLSIRFCQTLDVVIRNESAIAEVIIFPKLKSLTLEELPGLRTFYGDNRGSSSSSTTIMENAATSPAGSDSLFDAMITFPALEGLYMEHLKISEIWKQNGYIHNSFCELKMLTIHRCENLKFAIPLAMLPTFQNLEVLEIWTCQSMSSEVESSNSNETINAELPLKALSSISLHRMPALKQTRLNSRSRNLYPNLEMIEILSCNSMTSVLLPSTAKQLLHLKDLSVENCEMMSEIIGEEEREEETNNELLFPELTTLFLDSENIKSFWFSESVENQARSGRQSYLTHKVWFPKLVDLFVRVKTFNMEEIELGRNDSTSDIKRLVVLCDNEVHLPSKWQLQLLNIKNLHLENCWFHDSSREHNFGLFLISPYATLSFQRLKEVVVCSCGVSALFSCSFFRNLHQLQDLTIKDCHLLEVVVRDENNIVETCEETISLLQLKSIELSDLTKLKSFAGSESYAFNMPALRSFRLSNCPEMKNFTCLKISAPSIPDFNSKMQKYLNNPNRRNEEIMYIR